MGSQLNIHRILFYIFKRFKKFNWITQELFPLIINFNRIPHEFFFFQLKNLLKSFEIWYLNPIHPYKHMCRCAFFLWCVALLCCYICNSFNIIKYFLIITYSRKMIENRIRWFDHVERRSIDVVIRKVQ